MSQYIARALSMMREIERIAIEDPSVEVDLMLIEADLDDYSLAMIARDNKLSRVANALESIFEHAPGEEVLS